MIVRSLFALVLSSFALACDDHEPSSSSAPDAATDILDPWAQRDALGDGAGPSDTADAPDTRPDASPDTQPEVSADTGPFDTAPADTALADTSPADTRPADTVTPDTGPPDTQPADTTSDTSTSDTSTSDTSTSDTSIADTSTSDTGPTDVGPDPCTLGPDTDGDGLRDACDACPRVPRVLLYDLHSERRFARAALERMGCEHELASIDTFTDRLASGAFGLALMDMPDARPEGAWAQALLDHVARGGAAIVASYRLNDVPGPSVPATFGASWGAEHTAEQTFTPTWVVPLHQRPNDLRRATLRPNPDNFFLWHGAPLTATAGRVWARFPTGGAIVESNGGRTLLNGFILDEYPYDTDGDGILDVVELLENQVIYAAEARLPDAGDAPWVKNFGPSETVRYDLPILRGTADEAASEVLAWSGLELDAWPVQDRQWKAPVPLRPGENWVTLEAGGAFTHLELDYSPQTNPREVRLVYAVAKGESGTFDAPAGEPNDLASAKRRLALGGRLLQAMLADRIYEAGFGRHTFRLKRDAAGEPAVHVWNTSATMSEWHAMNGAQMWSWIWGHIGELPACGDCKTIIILGMTRYDPASGRALAHTALGGGGVALFGSATLYSWAESLDELVDRLSDDRYVSSLSPPLYDDSGYRGTLWANFATGLGAVLHELAHAMELPHAVPAGDIVNRGFDHVNRLVMASEPPSATSAGLPVIFPQHEPTFLHPNLGRLRWHRYSALDDRAYTVNSPPQVSEVGGEIRISTTAGLRAIGFAKDMAGDWQVAAGSIQLGDAPPTLYTFPKSSISFQLPGVSRVRLYLTDDQGNINDNFIVTLP